MLPTGLLGPLTLIFLKRLNASKIYKITSKDRNPSCKIYEMFVWNDICGRAKRNVKTRWVEHEKPDGKSEPSRHVVNFSDRSFTSTILLTATEHEKKPRYIFNRPFETIFKWTNYVQLFKSFSQRCHLRFHTFDMFYLFCHRSERSEQGGVTELHKR